MPEDSRINNREPNYHNLPQCYAYCTIHDSWELDFMFITGEQTHTQKSPDRHTTTPHPLLLHSYLLTPQFGSHHTAGKLKHLQIRSSCKQLQPKLNSQIHVSVYALVHRRTQTYYKTPSPRRRTHPAHSHFIVNLLYSNPRAPPVHTRQRWYTHHMHTHITQSWSFAWHY